VCALQPEEVDVSQVMPLFIPASQVETGRWGGPHVRLRLPDLAMTWGVLAPGNVMEYVTFEMQAYWDGKDIDWKRLAWDNLAVATNGRQGFRALCRLNGKPYAMAFLFEDGLGSSRLLLRKGLEQMFPKGYRVAVPERSCGFAFSADVSTDEAATVQGVVDQCYRHGTHPLLPGSYLSSDLLPDGVTR